MIEAICDRCGRRIELKFYGSGFAIPEVWKLETQFYPDKEEVLYRIFCFDCRKDLVKKAEE